MVRMFDKARCMFMSLAKDAQPKEMYSILMPSGRIIVLQNQRWTLSFFFALWGSVCLIIILPTEGKRSIKVFHYKAKAV